MCMQGWLGLGVVLCCRRVSVFVLGWVHCGLGACLVGDLCSDVGLRRCLLRFWAAKGVACGCGPHSTSCLEGGQHQVVAQVERL